ncbi:MAG TPA: protoglobin domain-containing protein, partial [Verrucomicrobiae bacterium]|nr:protoglobin domain-containing protein [Verrucomicrobiae bacterium]
MLTMQDIRNHYFFTDEDAALLLSLRPLAERYSERMADEFYDYLLGIPETAQFLRDQRVLQKLKKAHHDWFLSLFCGNYDNQYMLRLQRVGQAHVQVALNAHFVNAAMNVVRHFVVEMLQENFPDISERRKLRNAAEKIIDINLDIMSASYQEAEINKVFVSQRLESKLIGATERFTYGLNLVLVMALAGVSIGVVALFAWDIVRIFHGDFEKGIL